MHTLLQDRQTTTKVGKLCLLAFLTSATSLGMDAYGQNT